MNTSGTGKVKRKVAEVEEMEDEPEKREPIPKVTWGVTKDKAVRELLEVRFSSISLPYVL